MSNEIEREVPADRWGWVVMTLVCVIAAVAIAVVIFGATSIGSLLGAR